MNCKNILWMGIVYFVATMTAPAQEISPHIGFVYPAGGKQGSTFEVTIAGQFLRGVTNALVSGKGIEATVIDYTAPITQKEAQLLRERLQELLKKKAAAGRSAKGLTQAEQRELEEIRKKLANFIPPKELNPALAETVKVLVKISPDAEPGEREIRLKTLLGLSNPRVFYVGSLNEYSRKPRKIWRQGKENKDPVVTPSEGEIRITLPTTVNGQIMPGGVDRYRFSAKKGQKIVVIALARQLIPYIPDAVPGWFQAVLTLYDSRGKELAFNDDFMFNPDPVLYYEIPADGEYSLEIRDSIYRGREDFVYRITIGKLPFITSIYPLGGKIGKLNEIFINGWNLPTNRIVFDATSLTPGIYPVSVANNGLMSMPQFILVDDLPQQFDKEPNNSPSSAQKVDLPIVINGKIDSKQDKDVFGFYANKGDTIVAEVYARRLNSPLDSAILLLDSAGNKVAYNDDFMDKGSGLTTHHADSYIKATIPANGFYYLQIYDNQWRGGEQFSYRLRISKPQPDFSLRITPSSLNIRAGLSESFTVYALRKDGFDGEIEIYLKNAPPGVTLSGARIPIGKEKINLTVSAPTSVNPFNLQIEGRTIINGKTIVRPAIPSDDMMQAFAYHHLVPAKELLVCTQNNFKRPPIKLLSQAPVKIKPSSSVNIPFEGPFLMKEFTNLSLLEPPDGISIKEVKPSRYGFDLVLQCDAEKAKIGTVDNLIVEVLPKNFQKNTANKQPQRRIRAGLGTLPAIPIEIVQ
ncbi:MAG: hypothetical protein ACP5MG_13900 [Verrucomicrobiia bacterium]